MADLITAGDLEKVVPGLSDPWPAVLLAAANSKIAREVPCLVAPDVPPGVQAEAKLIVFRAIERLTETRDWIRSETTGPFSVTYVTNGRGLLTATDLAELQALCGGPAPSRGGLPRGNFPLAPDLHGLFRGAL